MNSLKVEPRQECRESPEVSTADCGLPDYIVDARDLNPAGTSMQALRRVLTLALPADYLSESVYYVHRYGVMW